MLRYLLINLDAFTPIFIGGYVLRTALVPPRPADPYLPPEPAKVRPTWQRAAMLLGGPLLVVCGLMMLSNRPGLVGPVPNWTRYFSSDGHVSICLPYQPQLRAAKPFEDLPEVTGLVSEPGRDAVTYGLTWMPIDAEVPPEAAAEMLEVLKGVSERQGNLVVSATRTEINGRPAYDFDLFDPAKKLQNRTRIVYVGRLAYTAVAAGFDFSGEGFALKRFFDSLRIERQAPD